MNNDDETVLCECSNCEWRGDVSECNEIYGLLDRVEAGDEFPAGECPKCGVLAYLIRYVTDENKDGIPLVIISVSGGCADVLFKPLGFSLTLIDYDVDGVEKTNTDSDGERCIISHWDTRRKVISNQHWPIIQQAMRDINCRCSRQWKCPSCSRTVGLNYEELADIGIPFCPDCDLEMEML
jgi:hypothetical protein